MPITISIAKDFSETPGPRSRDEGEFSGEQFLEEVLEAKFIAARDSNQELLVDLDATEGYATSFLEAAFGGLARKYGAQIVNKVLRYKTDDEPYLEQEIRKYIHDVEERAK